MNEPEIFLHYHGPVDLPVIESLLKKLKKTKELVGLNKPTFKRTYALLVECLENIYKYSELKSSGDKKMHPDISIHRENSKIIILAGNPILKEAKEKLVTLLEKINESDYATLKSLYEKKISGDSEQGQNGAGLGLISMALKSGNKINYHFYPLVNGYLYFEIQISLNIYIMRKLIIDQTPYSPKVILDPEKKIYMISGESRPPDVREFYDQVITWMDDFSIQMVKSENKTEPVKFSFNFEYFNSSSGKIILDICKVLARMYARAFDVTINWHYEKDDVDMLEAGREISRIVKFPFEFTETEPK